MTAYVYCIILSHQSNYPILNTIIMIIAPLAVDTYHSRLGVQEAI